MNQESTSGPTGFALERLSGAKLVRLGLAEVHPPTWPPSNAAVLEPAFRPTSAETPGTIYVLQAPPLLPVKIGFTRADRIEIRILGLQTGCPYPLQAIATASALPGQERRIHALLKDHRLTGEWFDWTPAVQKMVDRIKAGRLPA